MKIALTRGFSTEVDAADFAELIQVARRRISIGYFKHEIEAALAYDAAARLHHGEFARCNYPDES